MYSWELQKLLELKNYLLDVKEYFKICEESPQITRVYYDVFNDIFVIQTSDNYEFKFKVRKL
jgi:hypothetical protein